MCNQYIIQFVIANVKVFFCFCAFFAYSALVFVNLSAEGGNNAPEREGILLP